MTAQKELEVLIKQADECLQQLRPYTTKAAQTALWDMIRQAKEAADIPAESDNLNPDCEQTLPFTGKREFGDWHWNKEDACLFAKKRYTMASVWFNEGKVYSTYGLEDAVEWYKKQDLRRPLEASELEPGREGFLSMEETAAYYDALCRDFLKNVTYGNEIGQYSKEAGEKLESALSEWQEKLAGGADTDTRAAALADCLNALWELRTSSVLRSETKGSPCSRGGNILLSAEEMEQIRRKIDTDTLAKEQYAQIKKIADAASLEQRKSAYRALFEPDDYERLNREFAIETSAGNRPSFAVPKGTTQASFSLFLPKEDNEQEGTGRICVWNIGLKASEGENLRLDIDAIVLCNPTSDHEASWNYDKHIYLRDDALYTLTFDAKQDGKFKKGMEIVLTFFDKDGRALGTHRENFNRKSWLDVKKYNLYTQCDAICYWYTKDLTYAEKSKIEMLHFLDDFCQGAHHWLRYNERPEGSDAYGGVQGGRILFTIAVAYSMIRDSGVWSSEETKRFYGLVSYMLRYLADLRDRTLLTKERAQRGSSNWQTDMHIGTAAIMMTIPDFPNRKIWMYNAEAVLKAQLDCKLNPDGSWPESLRYHFASLEHFSLYARLWQRESGKNWFVSEKDAPGLVDMFRYPLYTQTPPYAYFENRIATPPFGDHKLGNGSEFSIYGLYCDQVAQYDPKTAQKMRVTWQCAGKPVKGFWGESVVLENLMYPAEVAEMTHTHKEDGEQDFSLSSCAGFSDSGIYVFRDHFGTPQENYLAVMSSPKKVGHGHLDQGAFIYYYHGVPVVMDSGIEGYFEASTPWHICSYSHAVMQFEAEPHGKIEKTAGFINLSAGTYSLERGWNDGPYSSRVTGIFMDDGRCIDQNDQEGHKNQKNHENREWISMDIENPKGCGVQHRTITIDHQAETVEIRDSVTDFSGHVLFNLPLLAKTAVQQKNEILAEGYYGIRIRIVIHTKTEAVSIEPGRATPMEPTAQDHTNLLYLRIKARAEDGFFVTIEPYEDKSMKRA